MRLLRLARILASSRRGLPLKTIAEQHGWQLRTLYRDIDALDQAGFPVEHVDGRYRLPPDSVRPPEDRLQPDERLALFTARQLAGGLRETAVGIALDRLWQRFSGRNRGAAAVTLRSSPGQSG